jgi:alkaline phosphatase
MHVHGPRLFTVLALVCLHGAVGGTLRAEEKPRPRNTGVDNVILMIGDGMGPAQVSLARWVVHPSGTEPLFMETLPFLGTMTTHSADQIVTDSAAAATAMAAGVKVANHAVSVDGTGKPLVTVLEAARAAEFRTGLVTTTRITHATPAAFASHVPDRDMEKEIAAQLATSRIDVLLGGGARTFPEELLASFRTGGYSVVTDSGSLAGVKSGKLLGLFAASHMAYELDRPATLEPSLADMTAKALEVLGGSPKKRFFLMVEGGRIDHAGHSHDAASVAADTIAFDRAVEVAVAWANKRKRTLVVITADHTTGALAISERTDIAGLSAATASGEAMGRWASYFMMIRFIRICLW